MYPESIPTTKPTAHDTLEARAEYIRLNADVEYIEWLQETYYGGNELSGMR